MSGQDPNWKMSNRLNRRLSLSGEEEDFGASIPRRTKHTCLDFCGFKFCEFFPPATAHETPRRTRAISFPTAQTLCEAAAPWGYVFNASSLAFFIPTTTTDLTKHKKLHIFS
jgi:hypothetical protein